MSTSTHSKCVIFPKGKTTWEGFQRPFKDGDVVSTKCGNQVFVFKGNEKMEIDYSYSGECYFGYSFLNDRKMDGGNWRFSRHATKAERECLFEAMEEKGYRWDAETKTLEKLIKPYFKVGDVIQDIDTYKVKITEVNIEDECYGYESMIAKGIGSIGFSEQDAWELVPNKFYISTLKPFKSMVLVRHNNDNKWCASFFSHIDEDFHSHCYKFVTVAGRSYHKMIPYEGNEHLLGKTDDCDEFYKTWE